MGFGAFTVYKWIIEGNGNIRKYKKEIDDF